MSRVTTVVFDVGNVLHMWDPRNLYRKIFDNEDEMEWFLANITTSAWNDEFDRGKDWDEAVAELSEQHPDHHDNIMAYHHRWEEMCGETIEGSVTIMTELRNNDVPLYAITNYSREKFDLSRNGRYPFLNNFDGLVVSGDEKLIKPDPAIYELLFERYDLTPETLVFIDDKQENIDTAVSLGMAGIVFTSAEDTREKLSNLGLPV